MNVRKIVCLTVGFAGATQFAHAQATGLDLDFEQINQQTGSSTTALEFYAAEEQAQLVAPGNPSNLSVTRPSGVVDTLNPFFTRLASYSHTYSTLASFNQDWGLGTYTFTGNSGALTAVVPNTYSMWAQTPEVTDYSSLQDLSPTTGGDITFSPFVQDPGATASSVSVYIYDMTQPAIIASETYSSPVENIDLTPVMLQQDQQYVINIEYLNVLSLPEAAGFQGAVPAISYNEVTDVSFNTAVPEPAPFTLFSIGLVGLAVRRTRTSRRKA